MVLFWVSYESIHFHKYFNIITFLGTGSNACYIEKLDKVKTWVGEIDEPKQVVINMEWGAYGDNGCLNFLRTEYDVEVDKTSLNPGNQLY